MLLTRALMLSILTALVPSGGFGQKCNAVSLADDLRVQTFVAARTGVSASTERRLFRADGS
jgi:hypothetical protein